MRAAPGQERQRPARAVALDWPVSGGLCWRPENVVRGIVEHAPDRHALAERLAGKSNPSWVTAGMRLAVQSGDPNARAIVTKHLNDQRWNWTMTSNDIVAQQLLFYLNGKPTEKWVEEWLRNADAG